jgi:hypothetical protein
LGRADGRSVAREIDRLLQEHYRHKKIKPTPRADEATRLRRLKLDLTGRVPTLAELRAFRADSSADKYDTAARQLVSGPEFSWYFGTVLDEMIQGRLAGNEAFVNYLRRALQLGKGWDAIFREVLLGPWEAEGERPASLFLDRRAKDLDRLTVDVAQSFFGVDISCARCHNHPLVKDWKQDHYYGLAAFFNRTTSTKGKVSEKLDGEVMFVTRGGKQRTAPMMFLSGRKVDEPKQEAKPEKQPQTRFSRREQLVRIALEDKVFLSRAAVNRMWAYFFGRGLVEPVDQMHSGNPASVPPLLDWLAADFVASGYNIPRLVTAITLSRAYQFDSVWPGDTLPPEPGHFAVAHLRPLSPRQLAMSLLVALGDDAKFGKPEERLRALEKPAAELMTAFDPRTADFQSSTREALFVSNSEAVRKVMAADGNNLAARLMAIRDNKELLETAFLTIFSRPPNEVERVELTKWLRQQDGNRRTMCEDLVWTLAASAEFRFHR